MTRVKPNVATQASARSGRSAVQNKGEDRSAAQEQSIDTLKNEVFELVCQHMNRIVGRRAPDYEDLVQLSAERAIRDLPGFEGRSSLSTWTFRVCYHTMLAERRWYKRWLRRFTLTRDGDVPEQRSVDAEASGKYEWHERNQRVRAAVGRLSPALQIVVSMHDLEGIPIDEVARVLELNPMTARSRLRDGRRDLARRLAKDPYFGDDACRERGRRELLGS